MTAEREIEEGWVAVELAEEFPYLGLACTRVEARPGRTPASVRDRLRTMSSRFTGGRAVHLRQESVPWAYRVFFRQVGIDPDDQRTPVEEAAIERLKHGGFRSRNLLDDALTIAVVETGVPVVAFDADRVKPPLGLRLSDSGRIELADSLGGIGDLFGDIDEGRGVTPDTERMLLAAVTVKGVPRVSVEEALWTVAAVLTGAD